MMASMARMAAFSLSALLLCSPRLVAQTGDLRVVVETSGPGVDPDGYVVAVDTLLIPYDAAPIRFEQLKPGIYLPALLGVAGNCAVTAGDSQPVVVRTGETAELRFDVVCGLGSDESPAPEAGNFREQAQGPSGETMRRQIEPYAGSFAVGTWLATIEAPGTPPYPVHMTLNDVRTAGARVGHAEFEATSWSCSFELVLESVSEDLLRVVQKLTAGYCPDGTRVTLTREGADLRAEWLHPDGSPWFQAVFRRST